MVQINKQARPVDPRASRRERRRARLRLIAGDRPATIKVFAANETLREVLRHPNGARFRDTIGEGVEWPNDSFTARRIADGSVRTDGPGSGDPAPDDPSLNAREQAAARKGKSTKTEAPPKEQHPRNGSTRRQAAEPPKTEPEPPKTEPEPEPEPQPAA
jgi:hypothetical protein